MVDKKTPDDSDSLDKLGLLGEEKPVHVYLNTNLHLTDNIRQNILSKEVSIGRR